VIRRRNPALHIVTAFAASCLLLSLLVPIIRERFSFAFISLEQAFWSLMAGVVCLLWMEWAKRRRQMIAN